jgi:uncharacterized Zn-binding protein involved in type VI secretion
MAKGVHIHGHLRACGATTVVTGQSSVYVNNELWAVVGDRNTHGGGPLINTTGDAVFIENKNIIVNGPDKTTGDCASPKHLAPSENQTAQGSGDTFCYD